MKAASFADEAAFDVRRSRLHWLLKAASLIFPKSNCLFLISVVLLQFS